MKDKPIWGVHMAADHGRAPVENNYVAIGWGAVGDLNQLDPNRDAFKAAYDRTYPGNSASHVGVSAGVLYRFVVEMQIGDIVVYPAKDRTINIGRVVGPYRYVPDFPVDCPNQRPIEWIVKDVPRGNFSAAALHEFGSFLTLFRINNAIEEVLAVASGEQREAPPADAADDAKLTTQAEEGVEDFILRRLKTDQSAYEFEHFVAHLLTAMGYYSRVTKQSGDGGVDIVAHRDELGFEPPIIKVQCKQTLSTIGRPDIQKLAGAIERDEKGLFVTLGSFTPDARTYEQTKPDLRLIDGEALVELIFAHYDKFEPRYRGLLPLRRAFLPSVTGDGGA